MDNELGANDPYRTMDSGEQEIRPDFLKRREAAGGALAAAENAAGAVVAAKTGKAPNGAAKGNTAKAEEKPKGLYKRKESNDEPKPEGEEKKKSGGLRAASPFLIVLLGLGAIVGVIIVLPVLMIGAIDYNLQKVLGFEETVGILEEVGEHVTAEYLSNGKVPASYASDLANYGVDVGQVLANGDFVKTDTYIADIDTRNDLVAAAGGFSYITDDEGELAMLYKGEVIRAGDFVAKVESDPTLYAAYSGAANISTKYYYGEDVDTVYKEMGLSRGNFNKWESTGDYSADEEEFREILNGVLGDGSELSVWGAYKKADLDYGGLSTAKVPPAETGDDGTYEEPVSGVEAETISSDVSSKTREYIWKWKWVKDEHSGLYYWKPYYSDHSTKRAAELLNTAVSSGEPYLASNAFIAIEESIQRARVNGDGPVNHVMNALTEGTEVTYQNVTTGANDTTNLAILETDNFRAAVSDSEYSKEEALNFGRDRVLKTTGQADEVIIKRTTVSSIGKAEDSSVVRNGKSQIHAEEEVISKANENIELSQAKNNSEAFQSVIGGNRIIEGGSFLSNTINMQVIGAMPSNSGKIAEYHQEVEKVMARRAEAERASKNPFDISSPYTFLGSIVHNVSMSILGSYGSGMTAISAIGSVGNTVAKAGMNLTGSAIAGGGDDEYTTMSGIGCETVKAAGGIEGDLYCTSHNTPSTEHIDYTFDRYKSSEIGEDIDEEGKPVKGSGLYEFVNYGMDRYASVGVKNAEVCERYHEDNDTAFEKVAKFFKNMVGAYDACDVGVRKELEYEEDRDVELRAIFTGAKYSFGAEGQELNSLYSSYVMYDEVKSLLAGEQSAVSKMREEYKKTHPVDYSRAGVVARRSGMSKNEAEIALAYSDYLTMIANYDSSDRFAFTAPLVLVEKPILEKQSDDVALNLYAWYSKETEYNDLRTRNFVV